MVLVHEIKEEEKTRSEMLELKKKLDRIEEKLSDIESLLYTILYHVEAGGRSAKKRDGMREIISRVKVQFTHDMNLRNPEGFVAKALRLGIMVFMGEKDGETGYMLVDPDFFRIFERYVEDKNIITKLSKQDRIKLLKVHKFLEENGVIFIDHQGRIEFVVSPQKLQEDLKQMLLGNKAKNGSDAVGEDSHKL